VAFKMSTFMFLFVYSKFVWDTQRKKYVKRCGKREGKAFFKIRRTDMTRRLIGTLQCFLISFGDCCGWVGKDVKKEPSK
jgi:hypothetical protein